MVTVPLKSVLVCGRLSASKETVETCFVPPGPVWIVLYAWPRGL
jgi:hypothetical protein